MTPLARIRPEYIETCEQRELMPEVFPPRHFGSHFAVVLACGTLLAIATLVALCWPESAVRP